MSRKFGIAGLVLLAFGGFYLCLDSWIGVEPVVELPVDAGESDAGDAVTSSVAVCLDAAVDGGAMDASVEVDAALLPDR